MTTKHTSGPWRIGRQDDEVVIVDATSGPAICDVYGDHNGERDANARLIVAAPDLLEALEQLLRAITDVTTSMEDLGYAEDQAVAAIKKARGDA
jgi:hypothetical protein